MDDIGSFNKDVSVLSDRCKKQVKSSSNRIEPMLADCIVLEETFGIDISRL